MLSTGFVPGFFTVFLKTLFLFVTCFLCVFCPDIKSSHEVEVASVTFFWVLAKKVSMQYKSIKYCSSHLYFGHKKVQICSTRVTTFIFILDFGIKQQPKQISLFQYVRRDDRGSYTLYINAYIQGSSGTTNSHISLLVNAVLLMIAYTFVSPSYLLLVLSLLYKDKK